VNSVLSFALAFLYARRLPRQVAASVRWASHIQRKLQNRERRQHRRFRAQHEFPK
jgi:hypothetical protein